MTSIKQEDIYNIKGITRKLPMQQAETGSTLRRMIFELSSIDDGDKSSK